MGTKPRRRSRQRQRVDAQTPDRTALTPRPVQLAVEGNGRVSGILILPPQARVLAVLAHGAGGGMRHPFMESIATQLAHRRVATLRYQFPYMEAGRKSPDSPRVATATVRAAVRTAAELAPELPLVAGGKSFGGRMTSTAAADEPLPKVSGLLFLGFPLHRPGVPSVERAEHLHHVTVPMLFLQGTRDSLAALKAIRAVSKGLGVNATLHVVEAGDHSFSVPKRSGRSPHEVMDELGAAIDDWTTDLLRW